ncbi:hypothetical protein CN285_11930 [Bacillus cereus]|nr:hypothetical protein CN285_11930 [Bacillus cereus]PGM64614.1 hypothetical protein CN947_07170 [Bacillus cereus]
MWGHHIILRKLYVWTQFGRISAGSLYVKELVCIFEEMYETDVNLGESNIFYSNMIEWKYIQNGGKTNELKHKTVYL